MSVRNLSLRFGGVLALDDVSLDIRSGEIVGLIGPNGSGKTSLFNCLTGIYRPDQGEIAFRGTRIEREAPHRICALGIARTFQNLAGFASLSVLDNVRLGAHVRSSGNILADAINWPSALHTEQAVTQKSLRVLETLGLTQVAGHIVSDLPFAIQKRVELARALATQPGMLLLDEVASGLTAAELSTLVDQIRALHQERSLTILLVEHRMDFVMALADHMIVLDFGRKIAEGRPEDVRGDAGVMRAYLGPAKR